MLDFAQLDAVAGDLHLRVLASEELDVAAGSIRTRSPVR